MARCTTASLPSDPVSGLPAIQATELPATLPALSANAGFSSTSPARSTRKVTIMTDASVTGVLRERASLQPDDPAFTFVDYEQVWDGVANSLTWAQINRRVQSLAYELRQRGSIGDRV